MKNIQRFKLPVVVAAGLHGALLLSIPGVVRPGSTKPPEPVTVTCVPVDEILRVTEPDPGEGERGVQNQGGQPLPELPEPLQALPTERPLFTTAVVSMPPVARLAGDLNSVPTFRGDGTGGEWNSRIGGPPIIDVRKLDRVPRATVQPPPEYPAGLRRDGSPGQVTVEFIVNAEGRVVHAEALDYSHRELVEPTIRAVLKWRFEPGRRAGRPVPFRMTVPVEFAVSAADATQ